MRGAVARKGVPNMTDGNVPSLLDEAERGDGDAGNKLFDLLYSELHRLAKRQLVRQGVPVTLSATTLLHEA